MEYIGNRLTGIIWIDEATRRIYIDGVGWIPMDMYKLYAGG